MNTFQLDGFGELPASRRQAYQFYGMVPLEDGFPGRRMPDGSLTPHPIYATYLIRDWLGLAEKYEDAGLLKKARLLADATVKRMDSFRGSLALFYEPHGLLAVKHRFYSGLTQARFLTCFQEMYRASGTEKYRLIAEKIFQSLTIDVKQGGCCRAFGDGLVIEEFPHETPNFVLNGWTTAIVQVLEYARASGNEAAMDFGLANMRALRALLPLYDLPELANSRYRLSGLVIHRLNGPVSVTGGTVHVGPDSYAILPGEGAWENTVRPDGDGKTRVDTILSRSVWPLENRVTLHIEAPAAARVTRYIGRAEYDGFTVRPRKGWVKAEVHEIPAGASTLEFLVPWEQVPLVGAPTNFSKRVMEAGEPTQRNVYHYLHIANLDRLRQLTGDETLRPWADKWAAYVERWPELYPGMDHRPVGAFRRLA